jgi:hypothetical protein
MGAVDGVRLGIADHYGWAVAVTARGNDIVDRRRIELVEPDLPSAPVEHELDGLDDDQAVRLVADVRAAAVRATTAALDELCAALPAPITAMSLRHWPDDFPVDIATLRRAPYNARADSVMYRQVLADAAHTRGWAVHLYDAKAVEAQAVRLAGDVLQEPRATLGAPWAKDHRVAFAATIVAGSA